MVTGQKVSVDICMCVQIRNRSICSKENGLNGNRLTVLTTAELLVYDELIKAQHLKSRAAQSLDQTPQP